MPNIINQFESAPIVHIELQASGSATMTFKDARFKGNVMDFHKPRDAESHARAMGFETITRKENPEYFVSRSQ
jgi:hypothetical protein